MRLGPGIGTLRLRGFSAVGGAAIGSLSAAFAGQSALLVSGVISARALGPEDRGYFALLVLFSGLLSTLLLLGSSASTAYFLARYRPQAQAIVRAMGPIAIIQMSLCVVLQGIVVWFIVRQQERGYQLAGLVSLVAGPTIILQQYGLSVLQGLQQFRPYNLVRTLPSGCYALLLIVAVSMSLRSLVAVTMVWVLANLLSTIVIMVVAAKGIPTSGLEQPSPSRGEILRFGAKGFLGSSTPMEAFRLDQIVVGLFLNPTALGIYVSALAFTNLPRFISQSLGMVALPHIASQSSPQESIQLMWRFFSATLIGAGLIALALALSAGAFVPFLYGSEFKDAIGPTRLLLLGAVLISARRILSDCLRGMGKAASGSLAELISWLVMLPSLALLAPKWQLDGVAFAVILSSIGGLVAILLVAIRYMRSIMSVRDHRVGVI